MISAYMNTSSRASRREPKRIASCIQQGTVKLSVRDLVVWSETNWDIDPDNGFIVLNDAVFKVFQDPAEMEEELNASEHILKALSDELKQTGNIQDLINATPFAFIGDHKVALTVNLVGEGVHIKHLLQQRFDADMDELSPMAAYAVQAIHVIAPLLCVLHKNGIYHCDIKPNNILVRMDGQVALCDFGAVKKMQGPITRHVAIPDTGSYGFLVPAFSADYFIRKNKLDEYWTDLFDAWSGIMKDYDLKNIQNDGSDYSKARMVVRDHLEKGIDILDRFKAGQMNFQPQNKIPMWFLDCYALGLTLFQCGYNLLKEKKHAGEWPWAAVTVLMEDPRVNETESIGRLTEAQILTEARWLTWRRPDSTRTETIRTQTTMTSNVTSINDDLKRRRLGEGAFGTVYRITDYVGMAMMLCLCSSSISVYCFDPKTKKTSTYVIPSSEFSDIKSTGLICTYQKQRKCAETIRASKFLCQSSLTRGIFPDMNIHGSDLKVFGVDLRKITAFEQPSMLLYAANMEDSKGVPRTKDTLVSLELFLLTAHRACVIHGEIRYEVLVEITDGFGIVGFSHVVYHNDRAFKRRAYKDLSMLYDLWSWKPLITEDEYLAKCTLSKKTTNMATATTSTLMTSRTRSITRDPKNTQLLQVALTAASSRRLSKSTARSRAVRASSTAASLLAPGTLQFPAQAASLARRQTIQSSAQGASLTAASSSAPLTSALLMAHRLAWASQPGPPSA
jgi:RIO-like serine/threonine protein kinase